MEQEELIVTRKITEEESAKFVGSGGLPVYSTPSMIAFMEETCFTLVQNELEEGFSTVGSHITVDHLKAVKIGEAVKCKALLINKEDKKLTFNVEVYHNDILIGKAFHIRYIVSIEKFLSKL